MFNFLRKFVSALIGCKIIFCLCEIFKIFKNPNIPIKARYLQSKGKAILFKVIWTVSVLDYKLKAR